jgi:hypothetical protein
MWSYFRLHHNLWISWYFRTAFRFPQPWSVQSHMIRTEWILAGKSKGKGVNSVKICKLSSFSCRRIQSQIGWRFFKIPTLRSEWICQHELANWDGSCPKRNEDILHSSSGFNFNIDDILAEDLSELLGHLIWAAIYVEVQIWQSQQWIMCMQPIRCNYLVLFLKVLGSINL